MSANAMYASPSVDVASIADRGDGWQAGRADRLHGACLGYGKSPLFLSVLQRAARRRTFAARRSLIVEVRTCWKAARYRSGLQQLPDLARNAAPSHSCPMAEQDHWLRETRALAGRGRA